MMGLTNTQFKVMEFIFNHMDTTGTPPTIREIASYFQWKSIGSAQDIIAALRKKGLLLSNVPGKSRQIVPTKDVTEFFFNYQNNHSKFLSTNFSPFKTKSIKLKNISAQVLPGFEDLLRVPLIGSVSAGLPKEAIENADDFMTFPNNLKISNKENKLFALEVDGLSMINAGLLPNDIVLVESCFNAKDNDIVIASIYNSETTVKRFAKKDSNIYNKNLKYLINNSYEKKPPAILIPENPNFIPIPFGIHEDDKIIGIVRSLYRRSII